ncbi:MAG: Rieske (2Fe-2S) protein [Acidobacteria bacterium]|nr:Rieske (2Fe-2S) protein [Acidobacteriota bacterium]
MQRRAAIGQCLGALAWWPEAARARGGRYRKLRETVSIPLSQVAELWRPAPFRARADTSAGRSVSLTGLALRTPEGLRAFALHCPHELCSLDLREDESADHPLLICPCHFSKFDPAAGGAVIAGPAGRGAYRFGVEALANRIEIREVEEEAL